MNCDEARQRWNDRLDENRPDPALDRHLASCGACRLYGQQMSRITDVLGVLRNETELIVSESTAGLSGDTRFRRLSHWRVFMRPATGIAAAIALLVGASLLYVSGRPEVIPSNAGSSVGDQSHEQGSPTMSSVPPRLGITLRGDSARRFLAVARPAAQDNVQVFWLYPTSVSRPTAGP